MRPVRGVVRVSVENYTDKTAIVKTLVSISGEITERGFYWGTNAEPSEVDNKVVIENEVGYKKNALFGLTPNTTYYVKAYATNSEGISYSKVVSFTTLENPKEYEYVDLGLPSGLKWATHNIGASLPEEYGNYYAWGEVVSKSEYTSSNSLTYGKEMSDISGNVQYDAATANWGGKWRMPTGEEMEELLVYCTLERTTQNGVEGYNVTGPTGNYIFIPASGYRSGTSFYKSETGYWSSSSKSSGTNNARNLRFYANTNSFSIYDYGSRYIGYTVRPVCDVVGKTFVTASVENFTDITAIVKTLVSNSGEITERGFYWGINTEPTEADNKVVWENEVGYSTNLLMNLTPNTTYYVKAYAISESGISYSEVVSFTTLENPKEYDYVDLGLPSGSKWATHNIGASLPEEFGNYYAWGEIVPKGIYTESNSLTYSKEMSDISGNVQYDAATANWGGKWRMPTKEEMQELKNYCTWEWTTQNGVEGYNVIGPTGNYIFLPAAGSSGYHPDNDGRLHIRYWSGSSISNRYSSTLSSHTNWYDYGEVKEVYVGDWAYRYYGYTIRPVCDVDEKPFVAASVYNYTDITAIINTYVSSSSEVTECGFYWGTSPEPSEADNKVVLENGIKTNLLMNLMPNEIYYVKSYATNEIGTSYSEVVSFTTLRNPKVYEFVDLGLPSGLLWATCNIGASSPEECGNYYTWGEIVPKITYTESNSLTSDKVMGDISGNVQYDAAAANWGGEWRMPTGYEFYELENYCTWEWTSLNGVNGYKVFSNKNGNYIFLPASGYVRDGYIEGKDLGGQYLNSDDYCGGGFPSYFGIDEGFFSVCCGGDHYFGRTVRPVRDKIKY